MFSLSKKRLVALSAVSLLPIACGPGGAGVTPPAAIDGARTVHSGSSSTGGGTGGGGGGGGGGVVGVVPVATIDKVTITKAYWFPYQVGLPVGELLVEAFSNHPEAKITLTDTTTGEFLALLPNIRGQIYGGSVIVRTSAPASITVTSDLGGTSSRAVIPGVL